MCGSCHFLGGVALCAAELQQTVRGGGGDSVTAVDFMTSCKFLSPGGAVACRADKRSLRKSETRYVLSTESSDDRAVPLSSNVARRGESEVGMSSILASK